MNDVDVCSLLLCLGKKIKRRPFIASYWKRLHALETTCISNVWGAGLVGFLA